ncbi:hypothetical protein ABEB36_014344 [Hypothenemus hampei]|uniref:Uncharacterized protein n=1 Tax=Hypothenemus hampei TaxID=57062 RepID=A0ABD1E522_HYPHA
MFLYTKTLCNPVQRIILSQMFFFIYGRQSPTKDQIDKSRYNCYEENTWSVRTRHKIRTHYGFGRLIQTTSDK